LGELVQLSNDECLLSERRHPGVKLTRGGKVVNGTWWMKEACEQNMAVERRHTYCASTFCRQAKQSLYRLAVFTKSPDKEKFFISSSWILACKIHLH
jgi:hypothetical protein